MMHKLIGLIVLVCCSCLGSFGSAAELDDAVAAAHRGAYAEALKRLSALADKGDARAQFDVGFMHAYGWGVPRDPGIALGWYRKAAEQGLAVAQHFVGLAYVNAEGVRPDDAEAARWFARAAAQGFVSAQYMLGVMMLNGWGVSKDPVQAYAHLVMAGQHGVRSASRLVQRMVLDDVQRAQAQNMLANWKPKPESQVASIAAPREDELLGLDRHLGEVADPASWPFSAIGVVTVMGASCTGTLVAPKLVLTAAHCLFRDIEPVVAGAVHFLAGLDKGVPASSSVAAQLIVAPNFVPTPLKQPPPVVRSSDDWALIVLQDALPVRPLDVKGIGRKELIAASQGGAISGIGYGQERRYSPTMLRNCRADWSAEKKLMPVQCLANFGYSGSPILVDLDGTPTVVGVLSMILEEAGLSYAASANQFETVVKEQAAAESAPVHP